MDINQLHTTHNIIKSGEVLIWGDYSPFQLHLGLIGDCSQSASCHIANRCRSYKKMKNIFYITSLIFILSSCIQDNNKLKGKWLDTDFSYPRTLTFCDSVWTDSYNSYWDSLPYYYNSDSIFFESYWNPDLIKYSYTIISDTLLTTITFDNQINTTTYFRTITPHYIEDVMIHLGIDIDLPIGYSNLVGIEQVGNSIYFPYQETKNIQYKVWLNNEQFSLDSLLHKKLFNLKIQDEFVTHKLFALNIDSKIEYRHVKLLKDELRKAGFNLVSFVREPLKENYYESIIGINMKLPPMFDPENYFINQEIRNIVTSKTPPNPPKEFFEKPDYSKPNVCKIEIVKNQIFYNDKKYESDIFYNKIQKIDTLFTYLNVDKESNYQTYYSFIAEYDSLRKKNRNEKSIELYQKKYNELIDEKEIEMIRRITKSRFIEY